MREICPSIFQCEESKQDASKLWIVNCDGPGWILLGYQRGLDISRPFHLPQKGRYSVGATASNPTSIEFARVGILDEGWRLFDELKDGGGVECHVLHEDTPVSQGLFEDRGDGNGVGGLL